MKQLHPMFSCCHSEPQAKNLPNHLGGSFALLRMTFGILVLILAVTACSRLNHPAPSSGGGFAMPQALVALDDLGITYSCYGLVSTDPDKPYPLTVDLVARRCVGEVPVKTGATFDLTVVFEADDPVSGQKVAVAQFAKTGLTAVGETMQVTYNDEEAVYDPTPNTVSSLNLDGDAWSNFDEIIYGSNPILSASLPDGPRAKATREDLLTQNDVSLPEGVGTTEALSGEATIKLKLFSPKPITSVKVVDPDFGTTVTKTADKEYSIALDTARYWVSSEVGTMTITVEITDGNGLTARRVFSFSVYNPLDQVPPEKVNLTLAKDQVIRDRVSFSWVLNDPSDVVGPSLILSSADLKITVPLIDTDQRTERFSAAIVFDSTPYPDGNYKATFEAKDGKDNLYHETVDVAIRNSVAVGDFQAVARLLLNGKAVESVPEDSKSGTVELDAEGSTYPYPSAPVTYSWLCGYEGNSSFFVGIGKTVALQPLPDVSRTEAKKKITCQVTLANGNFTSIRSVAFDVTFVNKAPTVVNTVAVTQETPTSPALPTPDNFKIDWAFSDPDGDALKYDLEITPEGAGSPSITCTNLQTTSLVVGTDQLSNCTLNLGRVGYGESVKPFKLAPRTDYTFKVTAKETTPEASTKISENTVTISDDGLVGWWSFDEGSGQAAEDKSGNGNDGTLEGGLSIPVWIDGINKNGLSFPGGNDHVRVPNHSSLNTDDLSVSVWIKTAGALSNSVRPILGKLLWENNNGYYLSLGEATAHKGEFFVGGTRISSSTDIDDGHWHHLVGAYSTDNRMALFVDGEKEAEATVSSSMLNTSAFFIGNVDGPVGNDYDDSLDEVAVYNRALTVDEVRRDCRLHSGRAVASGEGGCPDPKSPIILSPKPGQELPPTRAFWSWRGERGVDDVLLYPGMGYELSYIDNSGVKLVVADKIYENSDKSQYHVKEALEKESNYNFTVIPIEGGSRLTSFATTRLFTTGDSVVSWWKFDENNGEANDTLNLHDGTSMNGVESSSLVPGSLSFDGVNDYVDIGELNTFDNSDFTIEGRVRTSDVSVNQTLLHRGDGTRNETNSNYGVTIASGALEFGYRTCRDLGGSICPTATDEAAMTITVRDSTPLANNTWFHFAAVRNLSTAATLYRNGVWVDDSTDRNPDEGPQETGNAFAWRDPAGNLLERRLTLSDISFGLNGLMDEVIIYNEALSAEVVKNNFCAAEALARSTGSGQAGTDPLPDVCFE